MKYLVTSDTHLGHDKMIEYCGRKWGFEDTLLSSIHSTSPDALIHLGDVCIGRDDYWHRRLLEPMSCKKWLIRGNHDRKTDSWYYVRGWDLVATRLDLKVYGEVVALTHKPIELEGSFTVNVHGHLHITGHHLGGGEGYQKLVYCDNDYTPKDLRKVIGK